MFSKLSRLSLALVIGLSLTACDGIPEASSKKTEEKARGSIHLAIDSELSSLDPRRGEGPGAQTLAMLMFEGLTRLDRDGNPQMALAKHVDISEDGRTYSFQLRDCYWCDGSSLTAFDVEYSWKTILAPRYPAPEVEQLYVIKNARDIREGRAPASELGVVVIDDQRLVVRLEEPTPHFLELLANHPFFPVPSINDRDNPHWSLKAGPSFISNGPFQLLEWDAGRNLHLRKNPFYWDRHAVQLAEIHLILAGENEGLKLFDEGKVDWTGEPFFALSPASLKRYAGTVQEVAGSEMVWLELNVDKLHNASFRRALSLAIQRHRLVGSLPQRWQGKVKGLIPGRSPEALTLEDQTMAQHLMKKAFENTGTAPVRLTLSVEREEFLPLAKTLKEQWESTLPLRIEMTQEKGHIHLNTHECPCADPLHLLKHLQANSAWEDPVFENLITMAQQERRPSKRRRILELAERLALEEAPVIPIVHKKRYYLQRPQLKGSHVNSTGWLDLKHAYIQETQP